jgi:hypothetical protein
MFLKKAILIGIVMLAFVQVQVAAQDVIRSTNSGMPNTGNMARGGYPGQAKKGNDSLQKRDPLADSITLFYKYF